MAIGAVVLILVALAVAFAIGRLASSSPSETTTRPVSPREEGQSLKPESGVSLKP